MTMDELLRLPVSFGLLTAARALGLKERKAYELAAAGEFPIELKRRGHEYIATRIALFRYLGLDPAMVAQPAPAAGDGKEPKIAPAVTCRCRADDPISALYLAAIVAAAKVLAEGGASAVAAYHASALRSCERPD
jgi:hypothetical protein